MQLLVIAGMDGIKKRKWLCRLWVERMQLLVIAGMDGIKKRKWLCRSWVERMQLLVIAGMDGIKKRKWLCRSWVERMQLLDIAGMDGIKKRKWLCRSWVERVQLLVFAGIKKRNDGVDCGLRGCSCLLFLAWIALRRGVIVQIVRWEGAIACYSWHGWHYEEEWLCRPWVGRLPLLAVARAWMVLRRGKIEDWDSAIVC